MQISDLRTATAADHAAVEGSLPLMGQDLTPAVYIAVLERLKALVEAWETLLAVSPDAPPATLLAGRSRLRLICDDLHCMSSSGLQSELCRLPLFQGRAQMIGALYVMEGSRLGGQLIARHVERVLGLEPGRGTSFFRGFGEQNGRKWSEFLQHLREDVSDTEGDEVIAGARKMFQAFQVWMSAS